MNLKAEMFPYPVLHPAMDDYLDSAKDFFVDIELKKESNSLIKGVANLTLNNDDLRELINQNKVVFVLHIEGVSSSYRELFIDLNQDNHIEFVLNATDFREKLQINAALVVNKDLENYYNKKFNPVYYANYSVPLLERGSILAYQDMNEFRLDLEGLSVTSMIRVASVKDKFMRVDLGEDAITLKLPEKVYEIYTKKSSYSKIFKDFFIIMFILPALTQAINKLQTNDVDRSLKWQSALEELLEGKNLSWRDESSIVLAQCLLGENLEKAVVEFVDNMEVQDE